VERLLEVWQPRTNVSARPLTLLEPCAGAGNVIQVVSEVLGAVPGVRPVWDAVEINPDYFQTLQSMHEVRQAGCMDFLEATAHAEYDAAITNPPYSLAMPFITKCLQVCHEAAFLLRLGFLASADRNEFMRDHTPDVYVLPNRPRYDPSIRRKKPSKEFPEGELYRSSADSADYAWMVFRGEVCPRIEPRHPRMRVLKTTPADVRLAEFKAACERWDTAHLDIVREFNRQRGIQA